MFVYFDHRCVDIPQSVFAEVCVGSKEPPGKLLLPGTTGAGCRVTGAMSPPSVEEREVGTRKSPVATGGHSSYQLLSEDESREEMPDSSPVPICRDLPVR